LHHVLLVHGSEANHTDRRRIGLAIRYVPTYVRQTAGHRDSAMLVRGADRHGHFDLEQPPETDFGERERATHKRATEDAIAILYRGAANRPGA
jgi:ectoine hydroxylase-related dioxygenase (phytanoyl-CoA dioxygenase family)